MKYAKLFVNGKVKTSGIYENMLKLGTVIKKQRPSAKVTLKEMKGCESNIFAQRV